jgi:hypothetical protein
MSFSHLKSRKPNQPQVQASSGKLLVALATTIILIV